MIRNDNDNNKKRLIDGPETVANFNLVREIVLGLVSCYVS